MKEAHIGNKMRGGRLSMISPRKKKEVLGEREKWNEKKNQSGCTQKTIEGISGYIGDWDF